MQCLILNIEIDKIYKASDYAIEPSGRLTYAWRGTVWLPSQADERAFVPRTFSGVIEFEV